MDRADFEPLDILSRREKAFYPVAFEVLFKSPDIDAVPLLVEILKEPLPVALRSQAERVLAFLYQEQSKGSEWDPYGQFRL